MAMGRLGLTPFQLELERRERLPAASSPIAVTTGIVLTKGGCNNALAVGGGRESNPWLISNLPTLLYHLIL